MLAAEWDDIWRYQNVNLTLLCLRCAGAAGRAAWNELLDSKLSVLGYGVVDPRIRGAHRVRTVEHTYERAPLEPWGLTPAGWEGGSRAQGFVEYVVGTNRIMIVDTDSPYAKRVPLPPARLPALPGPSSRGAPAISAKVQSCAAVCAGLGRTCSVQLLARINTCGELQRYQVGCRSCAMHTAGAVASPFVASRWACFTVPHRHLSCHRAPVLDTPNADVASVLCACV